MSPEELRKLIDILPRTEKEIPSREVTLGQAQTKLTLQASSFDLSQIMRSVELEMLLSLFEPKLTQMLRQARLSRRKTSNLGGYL